MKKLILMRHSFAEEGINKEDYSRDLTEHGKKACYEAAIKLRKQNIIPNFVIASSANRTKQTAEIIITKLNIPNLILYDDLYNTDEKTILDKIILHKDESHHLLVIAHNPTISQLASKIAKDHISFEPSSFAIFDFDEVDLNSF